VNEEVKDLAGRVAVVTGAGRGLGRSYALHLARRGAAVVVNDIGAAPAGDAADDTVAGAVVAEIEQLGGKAVAVTDSVATPEGGAAVVDAAIASFGQVDVLVHNAGVVNGSTFAEQPLEQVRQIFAVHLLGAWHVGQPAWRHMAERDYGRVVLTSSMAQFGHLNQPAYAAAKTGIIGLAKSLAHEADQKGLDIKVNVICPLAGTRLARENAREAWRELMAPENVAGVVGYLVSDDCPLQGQVLHAGGSHVALGFLGQTRGWAKKSTPVTPADVRAHLPEILDAAGHEVPVSANDQMAIVERFVLGRAVG
jgi:NAD(P)-dependent dehydrogenase (short-subunit alcohol dehydrogenase family)